VCLCTGNQIGTEGAIAVAEGVRRHTPWANGPNRIQLNRMWVSLHLYGDDGSRAIREAHRASPHLTVYCADPRGKTIETLKCVPPAPRRVSPAGPSQK